MVHSGSTDLSRFGRVAIVWLRIGMLHGSLETLREAGHHDDHDEGDDREADREIQSPSGAPITVESTPFGHGQSTRSEPAMRPMRTARTTSWARCSARFRTCEKSARPITAPSMKIPRTTKSRVGHGREQRRVHPHHDQQERARYPRQDHGADGDRAGDEVGPQGRLG